MDKRIPLSEAVSNLVIKLQQEYNNVCCASLEEGSVPVLYFLQQPSPPVLTGRLVVTTSGLTRFARAENREIVFRVIANLVEPLRQAVNAVISNASVCVCDKRKVPVPLYTYTDGVRLTVLPVAKALMKVVASVYEHTPDDLLPAFLQLVDATVEDYARKNQLPAGAKETVRDDIVSALKAGGYVSILKTLLLQGYAFKYTNSYIPIDDTSLLAVAHNIANQLEQEAVALAVKLHKLKSAPEPNLKQIRAVTSQVFNKVVTLCSLVTDLLQAGYDEVMVQQILVHSLKPVNVGMKLLLQQIPVDTLVQSVLEKGKPADVVKKACDVMKNAF